MGEKEMMENVKSKFGLIFFLAVFAACPAWSADEDPAEEPEEAPAVSPESGARLEILNDVYDFGVIHDGQVSTVTHTFHFKSAGTEDLVLTKIKPSCGCTSAIASATHVAPGQEGTLSATMNPKGKFGMQTVSVRVNTNDPTKPTHTFRITGTILSGWRIIPSLVTLKSLGRGEKGEQLVHVVSQYFEGESFGKITHVRSDNPAVQASTEEYEIPKGPEPGRNYIEVRRPIRIEVAAGEQLGDHQARVLIATDDPKNGTETLTVRWKVDGDLAVSTNRITTTRIKGRSVPRPLELSSRTETPFEVLSIEAVDKRGGPNVLEITPNEDNSPTHKTYQVKVMETPDAGRRSYNGEIVIKTNHPEAPVVTVPYTATIVN